jgi:signal peptidase I
MNWRWFVFGSARHAGDMLKHVRKLVNAQRDILSPQAVEAVSEAMRDTEKALEEGAHGEALDKQTEKLEATATKWIKPYPNSEWRENTEVFLVAIVVAMAIRTFFLQPFKIPTGSMEPTLFGIETMDLHDAPNFKMPNGLERFWDSIYHGTSYHQVIAAADGRVTRADIVRPIFGIINRQTFWVQYDGQEGETPITVWRGPDGQTDPAGHRYGIDPTYYQTPFHKGDSILLFKETTGDHLFVDRVTYNFRHPRRGDIIVFKTAGIAGIPDPTAFYIKRLVGLPGETISIGADQHARVDGHRLDASTPHFQNVYGFDPKAPSREGRYGQWNGHMLQPRSGSLLRTPEDSIKVDPGNYAVFGDNTMNSLDSRYWHELPQTNVIGKSFFVYWPFSSRFGWNSVEY